MSEQLPICIECGQRPVTKHQNGTPAKLCATCAYYALMDFINEPDDEDDDAEWARITAMSSEEVEAELKAQGISTEVSPEVRARFEAACQKLRERAAKDTQ